jgi:hypothetical protein
MYNLKGNGAGFDGGRIFSFVLMFWEYSSFGETEPTSRIWKAMIRNTSKGLANLVSKGPLQRVVPKSISFDTIYYSQVFTLSLEERSQGHDPYNIFP